jgi:hypothetical protein
MVQFRKLAKVYEGSVIVGASSVDKAREITDVDAVLTRVNSDSPFRIVSVPVNTFVTRGVALLLGLVRAVFLVSTWPKVLASVIQRVSIGVVSIISIRRGCYESVHTDGAALGATYGVETSFRFAPVGIPTPLIKPLVIGSIYDGYLTLGKWDEFDRLVLRLDDGIALAAILSHDLTPNEIMRRSAAFLFYVREAGI